MLSPGMRLSQWLQDFFRRHGSSAALATLLGFAAIACAIYLAEADPPWSGKAAERAAAGEKLRPQDYGQIGLWWAALGNLGIAMGTLGFWKLWSRKIATIGDAPRWLPARDEGRRWFILALLATVVAGAVIRAPRLESSLWNDEEYAARRYSFGEYRAEEAGAGLNFRPATWEDALWKNKINNHLWHSVEARISLLAWQRLAGKDRSHLSEAAMRFLPFLSGLGCIAMVGILGNLLGNPRAGSAAAILLALNPWHLRYSVEARGYSSMLFFLVLAAAFLISAMATGRWRWWLAFAGAQAVYFLCFAMSAYVVIAFNAVALGVIAFSPSFRNLRLAAGSRLVVGNLISGLIVLPLFLPSIPQILNYLADPTSAIHMSRWLLIDLWTHLGIGVPWNSRGDAEHLGTSVETLSSVLPLPKIWIALITPVMFLYGSLQMLRKGWSSSLVAGGMLCGVCVSMFASWVLNSQLHIWYLIAILIPFVLSIGWALAAIPGRWSPAYWVLLALAAWVCADPIARIARHDRQPIREVIFQIRGESPAVTDKSAGILTATFGSGSRQCALYDPRAVQLESTKDLESLEAQSRETRDPLYVFFCGRDDALSLKPELVYACEDRDRYEHFGTVKGLELLWTYQVYRYLKPRRHLSLSDSD